MKTILLGIIVCLSVLWLQSEAQASHLPSMDVQHIRWLNEENVVRNQIWAGSVNFGDEVILAGPGQWSKARTELNTAAMLGIISDLAGDPYGTASGISVVGHRYGNQGWNASPILYGMQPKGVAGDPAGFRVGLFYDRLAFAPEGSTQHTNWFDSFVQRVVTNGQPDLRFEAGSKYVLLSELVTLMGR